MLKRDNFVILLDKLTSPISRAEIDEIHPNIFKLTINFYEDREDVYKLTCSPVSETNFSVCEFISSSVMNVAHFIYSEGLKEDDKYIVATSGFRDACERVISRYQKELDVNELKVEFI